jgi:hypothetical protein
MIDPFHFLLAALAVWRLSHLLVFENGPGLIFERMRQAGAETWVGRLLDCFYCTSLWIAAPMAALISGDWLWGVITWLALSGFASLALQMMDKRRELVGVGGDAAPQPAAEPEPEPAVAQQPPAEAGASATSPMR